MRFCITPFFFFCLVAAKLGIPSPPPYLSVPNNVDKLLQGVNYASGGAGILNETGLYFVISHSNTYREYHFVLLFLCSFCLM